MSSAFGKLAVIVNPTAGRGHVAAELPELERTLIAKGLPYRLLVTEGPGDATRFAREALEAGDRYLVAVGGDGTLHEIVNGIVADDRPLRDDIVLGAVAAGSGCDFVRTFGLPGDVVRACTVLTTEATYALDVGKVSYVDADGAAAVRYFLNIAEAGLGGQVVDRAERLPRWFGRSRYFFGFWLTLPRWKPAELHVEAERKRFDGRGQNVIVANGQFYGGGMRISPRSYPGDGLFDILVLKGPRSDAFTTLPKVYRGEHLPHPNIEEMKWRRVTVDADRPLRIEADGEVLGTTPATFEVLPKILRFKI